MKKSVLIIILSLTALSLMAFGYVNWNKTEACKAMPTCNKAVASSNELVSNFYKKPLLDLVYKVESRFMTTVTKEKLHHAKSILDIVPEEANWKAKNFRTVTVGVLQKGSDDILVMGNNKMLDAGQTMLLKTTDYSSDILVRCGTQEVYDMTGRVETDVYYMTVVPENEATYAGGHEVLIEYIKEQSKAATAIITQDKLKAGKVRFTITKNGAINNVHLESTSGYDSVDENLIDIVRNMPGNWNPATNSKGEGVQQELVFFFGLMGC